MLRVYKNHSLVAYEYSSDDLEEFIAPDVVVSDEPAAMPGDRYHYQPGHCDTDPALYLAGPCRCGGHHAPGRFLNHDSSGFAAGNTNVYRYAADGGLLPPEATASDAGKRA